MRMTALRQIVCWAVILAAGVLQAGEPDAPAPKEPPKLMVRERTVYVPYEKLAETFEKEGRGVFLPYAEFLKLWNAAQPKPPEIKEPKPPAEAVISGGAYVGAAREEAARFEVTYKVKALGKNWSEIQLPLRNVAVETVTLSDPQAVFAPKGDGYTLYMPKPGEYTVTLAFSVRINIKPGQRSIEFGIPPTAVSRLELTIPEKDLRVDVTPKMAAAVSTSEENATRLQAFVGNASEVSLVWMPPAGKAEKGESLVIASQAAAIDLRERILRLDTTISYRIERHDEDLFRVKLPGDMRLLSVQGTNIREWSAENGVLSVRLHAPVKDSYALALRCERILAKTPEKLDLPFAATLGTLREDGLVVVMHEPSLRVRVEMSAGLSQVDPKELPEALRKTGLLAGFRYLAHPLALSLAVEQVQPQVHSKVTAIVSLGAEDDVLTGWVDYKIAKVGLFTMPLRVPSRWEVSSLGDPQTVEDFQTAAETGTKLITINLKSSALGTFRLPFRFNGAGRAAPGEIVAEAPQVLDTLQDTGLLGVSAPKAFKLTTVERTKTTPENVQSLIASGLLAQLPQDQELPLAYSYTQQPASVKVALEKRRTEIHVNAFHEIIVSETVLKMSHKLQYQIDFAAVDKLQFTAPKTLDERMQITCQPMKEKRKISEENGVSVWELTLQEKMLGPVTVRIDHDQDLKSLEPEKQFVAPIPDISARETKPQQGYIAVCKDSLLEIEPVAASLETLTGMELPPEMRQSNVYLAYRYFEPQHSLQLKLTRHEPIETAKTLIDLARATFVVSEEKRLSARVVLYIENAKGEQYLELEVPQNSIRSVSVNNVSVTALQRKQGGTLIKLPTGGPFPVEIIYSAPLDSAGRMGISGTLELTLPKVLGGVPVNRTELDLYLPEDYAYMGLAGTLHLRHYRLQSGLFPELPALAAFPIQGRPMCFQTLAPEPSVRMRYWDRKVFWLIDLLVFGAAALLGGYIVLRRKYARATVCTALILIPLCLRWFATGNAAEPFTAWLCGSVLVTLCALGAALKSAWIARREARLAAAPDPFLEDAETPPAASESTPPKPETPADNEQGEKQ